jgi:atypical dual specificity phosphatase
MNHITFKREASLITPRIYLSGLHTASIKDELTDLGITHVISVVECQPTFPTSITPKKTLHIPIVDSPRVDILIHLETTTNFISSALAQNESNKVLVSANRASCKLCLT